MIKKVFKIIAGYIKKHKIVSFVIVILLLGVGYWAYVAMKGKSGPVSYVTSPAENGTIVTSVSGSGQVSPSNQLNLKAKSSGDIIYVGVKNGQYVNAGALIAQIDFTDAQKAVRDAEQNLQTAQIALQKLKGPSSLSVPQNKQDAEDALTKDYEAGYNNVANAFIDLPTIMTGLNDILYGFTFNKYQQNIDYYAGTARTYDDKILSYRDSVDKSYQTANSAYEKNFDEYKATSRFSDQATIDSTINKTYNTAKDIAQAIKDTNNLIQLYKDTLTGKNIPTNSIADAHLSSLSDYLSKANAVLINLLDSQSAIKSDKDSIQNADLDVKSQEVSLQQKQNALQDAKDNLLNYYVYAPFSGVVADVSVKKDDTVSNGTTVATLITNQSITEIPFNEVDITKIKVGQKATLTFDAINGLTIVGQVQDIDTLGTVTQGVVNYNVKIVFDTQNSQVKPGMSVTASVITDAKQNVLLIPNSAIKQSGNAKYAQVLVKGKPEQRAVETGLSNDTDTEITSGLSAGEEVITQTIASPSTNSQAQNNSFRIPGVTGGGGVRIQTGGGFRGD